MIPRIGAKELLTLIFVGFSAFSTVNMALAANNYVEFFPAILGATVRLNSVNPQSNGDINVLFVVENPTGYTGIWVRAFQASLSFINPNGTLNLVYGDVPGVSRIQGALNSHSKLEFPGKIPMPGNFSAETTNLTRGKVVAQFEIALNLSTFLDSISWIIINYNCNSNQTATSCVRTGSTTVPVGGGGGGGA
jgi:hypothetical protein